MRHASRKNSVGFKTFDPIIVSKSILAIDTGFYGLCVLLVTWKAIYKYFKMLVITFLKISGLLMQVQVLVEQMLIQDKLHKS